MNLGRQSLPASLARQFSGSAAAHPALGVIAGLAFAVAGCSAASQGRGHSVSSGATAHKARPQPARPLAASSTHPAAPSTQVSKDKELATASRPATSGSGVITRAELRRLLDQGPQAFIQRVLVRPTFRSGHFYGWRVLGYSGPGPVRPGDIVQRVNGRSLERPEQFMEAWEGLSRRSELVLEMVRGGRRMVLRWSIMD